MRFKAALGAQRPRGALLIVWCADARSDGADVGFDLPGLAAAIANQATAWRWSPPSMAGWSLSVWFRCTLTRPPAPHSLR